MIGRGGDFGATQYPLRYLFLAFVLFAAVLFVAGCTHNNRSKPKVTWCQRSVIKGFVIDGLSVRNVSCKTVAEILQKQYSRPDSITEPERVGSFGCHHIERRDLEASTMRCVDGKKAFRWAVGLNSSCAFRKGPPVWSLTKRGLTCDQAFAIGKLVIKGPYHGTKTIAGYRCTGWSYGGTESNIFCDGVNGTGIRFNTGF